MSENIIYLVEAKSPSLPIDVQDFEKYITTSEEFKRFSQGVIDLEGADKNDPLFLRYMRKIERVNQCGRQDTSQEAPDGLQRVLESKKGKIKVGYTKLATSLIYVEYRGHYLRGFKVALQDLCLVEAMNFVPLDKSLGNGNIEILQHTKRKATKAIKVVHNEVQSVLYLVDAEFQSKEEMEEDKASPRDLDLSLFISPLI